mgnify:CR=1 FL=1
MIPRRPRLPFFVAALLLLAYVCVPFGHLAWGHGDACEHAQEDACERDGHAQWTDVLHPHVACGWCAFLGGLQSLSHERQVVRLQACSVAPEDARAHAARSAPSDVDSSMGGARAPPC